MVINNVQCSVDLYWEWLQWRAFYIIFISKHSNVFMCEYFFICNCIYLPSYCTDNRSVSQSNSTVKDKLGMGRTGKRTYSTDTVTGRHYSCKINYYLYLYITYYLIYLIQITKPGLTLHSSTDFKRPKTAHCAVMTANQNVLEAWSSCYWMLIMLTNWVT